MTPGGASPERRVPRLILFDIDGTLIRAAGAGRHALESAFRAVFALEHSAEIAAEVRFNGRTDPAIIADMARAAGLAEGDIDRRGDELQRTYLSELRNELARPDPRRGVLAGVVPLLDALRSNRSVCLGLLTGNIEEAARIKLRAFALDDYFVDGGFASDHHDRSEIARIARAKLSSRTGIAFAPNQTVVVGDTEHDVACARANGYSAVLVESGWIPRERLLATRPDAFFPDFLDRSAVFEALGVAAPEA